VSGAGGFGSSVAPRPATITRKEIRMNDDEAELAAQGGSCGWPRPNAAARSGLPHSRSFYWRRTCCTARAGLSGLGAPHRVPALRPRLGCAKGRRGDHGTMHELEPNLRECSSCHWQLNPDRFREGASECVGCEVDSSRELSRPSYPQQATCTGCGIVYWRFSPWRRFHSIECARRFGSRSP
jgi:hypothetical protein